MGPLQGVKIVEVAGLGPAPFAAMLLSDLGADVIRVDRAAAVLGGDPAAPPADVLNRGRRSIGVDLKQPEGVETLLALIDQADVVIEGFRPGVAERLGFGPDVCLGRNPKLVYGRMTGWGQTGPWSQAAGHDINYIALAGVLAHIGRVDRPTPPLNLVGDFGGGSMMLIMGVLSALISAGRTGQGQVVDAAMVDGAALLMTMMWGFHHMGVWDEHRESNLIDAGGHFYDVYETADGRWISIGPIEPQFYAQLMELTGLAADGSAPPHIDKVTWPESKRVLADVFRTKTRAEWDETFAGTDVCYAPVLTMLEATEHSHMKERNTFVEVAGYVQPAPAPRFSETPGQIQRPPAHTGQHTDEVLGDWLGLSDERVRQLRESGAVA